MGSCCLVAICTTRGYDASSGCREPVCIFHIPSTTCRGYTRLLGILDMPIKIPLAEGPSNTVSYVFICVGTIWYYIWLNLYVYMHILIGKSPHVNSFPIFAIILGVTLPWLTSTHVWPSPQLRRWRGSTKRILARAQRDTGTRGLPPASHDLILEKFMRRHGSWSKDIYTVYTWSLGCIVCRTLAEDLGTNIITGKEIPHGTTMNKNQGDGKTRQRNSL